jgi:hypothetical protein
MKRFLLYFLMFSMTLSMSIVAQDEPPKPVDQNAPLVFDFIDYDNFSKSTGLIFFKSQGLMCPSGGSGSGFIVEKNTKIKHPRKDMCRGLVMTAWHVVNSKTSFDLQIKYQNGLESDAHVISGIKQKDIALISCWVPANSTVIPIADELPKYGETVRLCGYGNICDPKIPRYFKAKVCRHAPDGVSEIVMLEDGVPGDSGGLVLNENNEAVGVISRGGSIHYCEEKQMKYVFPAIAISIAPMKVIMDRKYVRSDDYTYQQYMADLKRLGIL